MPTVLEPTVTWHFPLKKEKGKRGGGEEMPLLMLLAKFPMSPEEGLTLASLCLEPRAKSCCLLFQVRPT